MKRGETNWTPIYLLIALIIAAVLILTFKQTLGVAQSSAEGNLDSARSVGSFIKIMLWS